jgi:hypothetical protein
MLYAEDLIEGQEFQLGTYTITEAEAGRDSRSQVGPKSAAHTI